MTNRTIIDLVDDLELALKDDRLDDADRLLGDLAAAYDDARPAETGHVERALVARERSDDVPQAEQLTAYPQAKAATATSRSAVLSGVAGYLADPTSVETQQVVDVVSNLRTLEDQLLDERESVADLLDDVTLPERLVVTGTRFPDGLHVVGGSYDLTVEVANVGDAATGDVTVRVPEEAGLSVTPTSASLGEVAPDGEASAEFTVTVGETGDYGLAVTATTADGEEGEGRTLFTAFDKRGLTDQAVETVGELRGLVDGTDALSRGTHQSLLAKIDATLRALRDAREDLEDHRTKQADTDLRTAAKTLGALLNQLDALENRGKGGESVPQTFLRTARTLAGSAVDQIYAAREADA